MSQTSEIRRFRASARPGTSVARTATVARPELVGRPVFLVDLTLRALWQLVGAYVWVVLVCKRSRPRRPS